MPAWSGIDDPLERTVQGIRSFLAFFAEHPQFVELLIQERALFKDRKPADLRGAPRSGTPSAGGNTTGA